MHFYIGPYLHCVNKIEPYTFTQSFCNNPECEALNKINNDNVFCGKCGHVIIGKKEIPSSRPSISAKAAKDIVVESLERVRIPQATEEERHDIWLPSRDHPDWQANCYFNETEYCEIDVSKKERQLYLFDADYSDLVEALIALYKNGVVKWGFVDRS